MQLSLASDAEQSRQVFILVRSGWRGADIPEVFSLNAAIRQIAWQFGKPHLEHFCAYHQLHGIVPVIE